MSNTTKGHIITQNLDGTDHLDCLYRISLKALIYNDAGQMSLKRELYEEVGYKGDLHYQLFDAS